jgi:hypothetical protein
MTSLVDIKNIIKPIPDYLNNKLNFDNILENLIMHNNMICNTYVLNHIIYNNKSPNFKTTIFDIIKKYIDSNTKNTRTHFRNLNKKNKLNVEVLNEYFDNIYKLVNKLSGMFQHIIPININKKKKWGDSQLWDYCIESINRIICDDPVFKFALNKSISDSSRNQEVFKLNMYIQNFSNYLTNSEEFYNSFVNKLDIELLDALQLIESDIDANIKMINNFRRVYKYYIDAFYNFNYITKIKPFTHLKTYIRTVIENILKSNDINIIISFLDCYKKEINILFDHIDLSFDFIHYKPDNIDNYIKYYNTIYNLTNKESNKTIIIELIKQNINNYFNDFDSINYLANIINNDINNDININNFYYILGMEIKNKDEFITLITYKLMDRIIYKTINIDKEYNHLNYLLTLCKNDTKLLYKYRTIFNDYNESKAINSMINIKGKVTITSYNLWRINYQLGSTDLVINNEEFTTKVCNIMYNYKKLFNNEHTKKLIVYPHTGFVDINIGESKLIVLPAHMFCLEVFTKFDSMYPYQELYDILKKNLTNYSDKFINDILNSLFIGGVLKKVDDMVRLRTDIPPYLNLIDVYHYNIKDTIKEKILCELANDRCDIIMSNINHLLKLKEYINMNNLKYNTSKSIKLFEVTDDLFTKAIDKLIKGDYIKIIDQNVSKIMY